MRPSLLLVVSSLILTSGCYLSHERPADAAPPDTAVDSRVDTGMDASMDTAIDSGVDSGMDAAVDSAIEDTGCDIEIVFEDAGPVEVSLDMLFVVDNSTSMREEQVALTREFPRLVRALVTGDLEDDGERDFDPVTDLRVGVITTEVSTGRDIEGCTISTFAGDDGILRTQSLPFRGCGTTYPPFLEFVPARDGDPSSFVNAFACVGVVGIGGCHYEQPLEAALKALTPSTSDTVFLDGTGRGDTDNAGFLRADALKMIVVVTDEDDCSARDAELFDPESTTYPPLEERGELQCFHYPDALQPPSRYVEGFRAIAGDDPDGLLFAAITGVPPDLVRAPGAIDYERVLSDPRMEQRIDPDMSEGARLLPACESEGSGSADPARRIALVARDLGGAATVQSICSESFTSALDGVTSQLARVIRRRRCRGSED